MQTSRRTHSTSLRSIKEEVAFPESPPSEGQPSKSDHPWNFQAQSFQFSDPLVETPERSSQRTRTAPSGNLLLTMVNHTGVFSMEVLYCICPNAGSRDEQLLQAGLFPSSFKQIETAFTFSVMNDFLIDNLECKTTAQQYFSKLQSITNRMFPDKVLVCDNHLLLSYVDCFAKNLYKQLLRASRQWRDLTNRMQSGLGYKSEDDSPPNGAMAIFCPACPQPGINLPDDWQTRYNKYDIHMNHAHNHADHFEEISSSEPL